jgi:hypothetical protein
MNKIPVSVRKSRGLYRAEKWVICVFIGFLAEQEISFLKKMFLANKEESFCPPQKL